eukprot:4309975-Pyramimonas_sp.AAC.1
MPPPLARLVRSQASTHVYQQTNTSRLIDKRVFTPSATSRPPPGTSKPSTNNWGESSILQQSSGLNKGLMTVGAQVQFGDRSQTWGGYR